MKNQFGQSLVEALVALGAAIVVISAVVVATITALNNADFSKNQNLATQYAQQAMEILRQQSETNWNSFSAYSGKYCLSKGSSTLIPAGATCPVNVDNFFIRTINIAQNNANCSGAAKVSVIVSWNDGKCNSSSSYCHNVTLDSCLANINNTLSP